jgi:2-iminobutanoate/2-iminopropanoate deaminase
VITSGQVGLATDNIGNTALVPGGTVPELHQALANVATVLAQEGATLADVVKTTLYLIDMGEFAALNEVWAALPVGARVEVEAWAYVPDAAR